MATTNTPDNAQAEATLPTGRFQKGDPRTGRKPGTPNKVTTEIRATARLHGKAAIEKLAELMDNGDPEVALKACRELLDRAYGRPAQAIVGDPEQPISHNVHFVDEFTRRIAAMGEKMKEGGR